jgi:hypothetical protein
MCKQKQANYKLSAKVKKTKAKLNYAFNAKSKMKSVKSYNKEHMKDKKIYYKLKHAFKAPELFTSVQNIHLAMKDDDKICYELVESLKEINVAISHNTFTNSSKK